VLVTAVIGFLTNDSGVVVPAMAMTLAIPLALAVSLRAVQDTMSGVDQAETVQRSGPASVLEPPDLLASDHGSPRGRGRGGDSGSR